MVSSYSKLYDLLEPADRKGMWFLLVLTLAMAILDTVGIASVMPFISVLNNPDVVQTNPYLAAAYTWLGFSDDREFLFVLGLGTFVLLMTSVVFRSITLWAQLRFTNYGIHKTACRMVSTYLNQPYTWFLNRHSADLGTRVLSEVTNVFQGAFYPAMLIVANALVTLFLVLFLVAVDPVLAGSSFMLLGGLYFVVFLIVRKLLARIGEERMHANHERYRILNEAFGGIKDVKAGGLEMTFVGLFFSPSLKMAKRSITGAVISEMPSFVLQGLVFGGMLVLLLYLISSYGSLQGAMPVIAIYALAGYRLLPALQGIYRNFSQLRFNLPSLDALHRDLIGLRRDIVRTDSTETDFTSERIRIRESCELRDITFRYPHTEVPALNGLNLRIAAHTTVGLVGASGSGKTTIVDVLLGLLEPETGTLLVDSQEIRPHNKLRWQRSIGYVSQSIFLAEGTIASNIAFGVPAHEIDMHAVQRAAGSAQLDEFLSALPDGLQSGVGEKGVRLSGGQRQRIGLARALYHDPEVLILDEATSALDNVTEQAVMKSIRSMSGAKTIVLIAHRLSSVRSCDEIHLIEGGRAVASGSYYQLLADSPKFRYLVESAENGLPAAFDTDSLVSVTTDL